MVSPWGTQCTNACTSAIAFSSPVAGGGTGALLSDPAPLLPLVHHLFHANLPAAAAAAASAHHAWMGGDPNMFFLPGPNPTLGGLDHLTVVIKTHVIKNIAAAEN